MAWFQILCLAIIMGTITMNRIDRWTPYDQLPPALQSKIDALHPRHGAREDGGYMNGISALAAVNQHVNNKFKYQREPSGDKWKTPNEFFNDNGGDCEDFAIYKFHLLHKRYGIDAVVLVVEVIATGEFHAVLVADVYDPFDRKVKLGTYVLDNRSDKLLRFEDFIADHKPIYSSDGLGIYQHLTKLEEPYNA